MSRCTNAANELVMDLQAPFWAVRCSGYQAAPDAHQVKWIKAL